MNRSRCSRTKNSIGRKRQPAQKIARVLQKAAPKTKGPGIARRGLGYRGRQTTTVCLLHHVKFEAAESPGLPLVMGQNKGSEIDNSPLLNWYRDQFREIYADYSTSWADMPNGRAF